MLDGAPFSDRLWVMSVRPITIEYWRDRRIRIILTSSYIKLNIYVEDRDPLLENDLKELVSKLETCVDTCGISDRIQGLIGNDNKGYCVSRRGEKFFVDLTWKIVERVCVP